MSAAIALQSLDVSEFLDRNNQMSSDHVINGHSATAKGSARPSAGRG